MTENQGDGEIRIRRLRNREWIFRTLGWFFLLAAGFAWVTFLLAAAAKNRLKVLRRQMGLPRYWPGPQHAQLATASLAG